MSSLDLIKPPNCFFDCLYCASSGMSLHVVASWSARQNYAREFWPCCKSQVRCNGKVLAGTNYLAVCKGVAISGARQARQARSGDPWSTSSTNSLWKKRGHAEVHHIPCHPCPNCPVNKACHTIQNQCHLCTYKNRNLACWRSKHRKH